MQIFKFFSRADPSGGFHAELLEVGDGQQEDGALADPNTNTRISVKHFQTHSGDQGSRQA